MILVIWPKKLNILGAKQKFHFPPKDLFLVIYNILVLQNLFIVLLLVVSNLFSVTNPYDLVFQFYFRFKYFKLLGSLYCVVIFCL